LSRLLPFLAATINFLQPHEWQSGTPDEEDREQDGQLREKNGGLLLRGALDENYE